MTVLAPAKAIAAPSSCAGRRAAELLLLCSHKHIDPEDALRIWVLVRKGIDWPYFLEIAWWHRLMPLLYWNLQDTCPGLVPASALQPLRQSFETNVRRNRLFTSELFMILELLDSHGIQAIALKGPALSVTIHGTLDLRVFRDLDLLIRRRDLTHARELLVSCGYRPSVQMNRMQEMALLRREHAFRYEHTYRTLVVELHWRLMPTYYSIAFDTDQLWNRTQEIALLHKTVRSLQPEDMLLFLCAHGAKHHWYRLNLVCDVMELVRVHKRMDWAYVVGEARTLRIVRMLHLGLALARTVLAAAVPEKVLRDTRGDKLTQLLVRRACASFYDGCSMPPGRLAKAFLQLVVRERLRDGISLCCYGAQKAISPNMRDRALFRLPRFLGFLYYGLRPARLVVAYAIRPLVRRVGKLLGNGQARSV